MGAISVRQLLPTDAEDFRAIRLATLALAPAYFGAVHETEAGRPLGDFAAQITGHAIFGAYAGDAIGGVIRLARDHGPKERHKGSIHGFFVRPELRRSGAGAALMRAALDAARQDLEQVTLTVVQGNDPAIALYRRFGFETYGIEPRARKTPEGYQDMVLMALRF